MLKVQIPVQDFCAFLGGLCSHNCLLLQLTSCSPLGILQLAHYCMGFLATFLSFTYTHTQIKLCTQSLCVADVTKRLEKLRNRWGLHCRPITTGINSHSVLESLLADFLCCSAILSPFCPLLPPSFFLFNAK